MSTVDAYADLLKIGSAVLTTQEAAVRLGTSVSNASHRLRSLADAGVILNLRRGLWSLEPGIDPVGLPQYLTAPFPAYVSLWSALSRHDMIEQIPRRIHVASTARSQRVVTSIAEYSVHHIVPEVFGGFSGNDESGYIATPEKALFDTIYIRAARGEPSHLPELSLPAAFDCVELTAWTEKLPTQRLTTLVERALRNVVSVG